MLRPWPAEDGPLVRVRLVGGLLTAGQLGALSAVAVSHGDGDLHLTGRANLQLRALDGDYVDAIEATGLLPSRSHELVRNVMVSPQTGLDGHTGLPGTGGRCDLRPVATALDALLVADPSLADLPGRFLFVLDDGRGDLLRPCDLGLVALDERSAQLRVGDSWGAVVPLADAAPELHRLARLFAAARGSGPEAAWHVDELDVPLVEAEPADARVPAPAPPLTFGTVAGGEHVAAPNGVLPPALVADLVTRCSSPDHRLVVTPWKGVLVP